MRQSIQSDRDAAMLRLDLASAVQTAGMRGDPLDSCTRGTLCHSATEAPDIRLAFPRLLPFVVFCVLIWPAFLPDTAQEDALISARHSRNLAAGSGLVYNIDQTVLGTTTPAWAAATAPVFWIPVRDSIRIRIIQLSSGLLAFVAVLILSRALDFESEWRRTAFIVLILVAPSMTHALIAGMETGLLMLITVMLWRCLSQQPTSRRAMRVVLACTLLAIRLDSICIIIALWTAYILHRYRRDHSVRTIASEIAVDALAVGVFVLAFAAICYSNYGQVLPQSMVAKANAIGSADLSLARRLARWPGLVATLAGLNFPWPTRLSSVISASIVWCGLWFIGVVLAFRCAHPAGARRFLLESAAVYLGLYSLCFVVGNAGVFPWYTHTPSLLFCGAVLAALPWSDSNHRSATFIYCLLAVGLCGTAVLVTRGRIVGIHEEELLRSVGERLRAVHANSVMLEPIGYIGYYSQTRVYDLGGLVSPDVFAYRQSRRPGWFAEAAGRFTPEYIVLRGGEVETNVGWNVGILFDSDVGRSHWESTYELWETVADERNRLLSYSIYRRKEAAIRSRE